ncbi:MAG: HAD family phosphatase, partial [Ruthenibacterium lactatiformans]
MDGLMFDTERIGHRGWKYGAQVLGLELPDEVIAAGRGMSVADSRAMYLERLGPEVDYDALRALRVAYADEAIARDGLPVKPGLRQLLEHLRA